MAILGIGVDIVHLPRISALISRTPAHKFASRILSPHEKRHWENIENNVAMTEQVRFLGVRWCVKEAAYKALYPAVKPTWKQLTYHPLTNGEKPHLQFEPLNVDEGQKVGRIHVSVSHDGEYIYSSVLVEGSLVLDIRTLQSNGRQTFTGPASN